MKRPAVTLFVLALVLALIPVSGAQDDYTPESLTITVYSDGTAKVEYLVESDPAKVRVTVGLFGPPFSNMVIRDEDGNPLGFAASGVNVTVDSIGALELSFVYLTSSLTAKEGALWGLNVTSPVETRIILPTGAAIFDINDIPLGLGTVNGKQYLDLAAGDLYVYYIVGLPSVIKEADDAIAAADSYISGKTLEGYILSDAEVSLASATASYATESYLSAKNLAEQALLKAQSTVQKADSASQMIDLATDAIAAARAEERTEGLEDAETAIQSALTKYGVGSYFEAESLANQAYQLALSAEKKPGNALLYLGVVVLVAAGAAGGYVYLRWKKREPLAPAAPAVPSTKIDLGEVDLEAIFRRHGDLRLEDKEVLRFLAESSGEAFASEIRERFDIPRSSAWRLIRRLVNKEIVVEMKVGNQSLVRVTPKYRK